MKDTQYIDFDSLPAKRAFQARVAGLRGPWRIELSRYRELRSNVANRYYWGVVVQALYQFLASQDIDITHPEQCHELLKHKFLVCDVVNKSTGEVLTQRTRSTTELNTEEFAEYLDKCTVWLSSFFGLVLPDQEYDAKIAQNNR